MTTVLAIVRQLCKTSSCIPVALLALEFWETAAAWREAVAVPLIPDGHSIACKLRGLPVSLPVHTPCLASVARHCNLGILKLDPSLFVQNLLTWLAHSM